MPEHTCFGCSVFTLLHAITPPVEETFGRSLPQIKEFSLLSSVSKGFLDVLLLFYRELPFFGPSILSQSFDVGLLMGPFVFFLSSTVLVFFHMY